MDDSGATGMALWSDPGFLAQATTWVREMCTHHGIELTGEREQPHNRPWSSAIRFGSTGGSLWLKVNGPGTRHEPPLVAVLSRLVPDLVAEVLATDVDRGWLLTRDVGPVLRSAAAPDQLWTHWEGLLVRYAEAQVLLADHVPELLATGTAEVSPTTLPGLAAGLLKELSGASVDEGGLTAEQREELSAMLPEYGDWCAELAASGIPDSIQHDDLHSANIGWTGSVATARIIDWGDASVGSPLGTMLCTLNSLSYHAGVDLDDARVHRVRDAYLEHFTTFAPRTDLVRYVGLARRTGCVTRALSYKAALQDEPVAAFAELDFPVRGWFLETLEH